MQRNHHTVATYSEFEFWGFGDTFQSVRVGTPDASGIALRDKLTAYFKLPDGEVKSISELVPQDIQRVCEKHSSVQIGGNQVDYYSDGLGRNSAMFVGNKAFNVALETSDLQISRDRDGPFISLPVNKQALVEAMGDPQWRSAAVSAP